MHVGNDLVNVYVCSPKQIRYVLSVRVSLAGLTYGVGFWLRIIITRSVLQVVHGLADPEGILLTSSQYDRVFAYFYKIVKSPRPEYVSLHKEKPIAILLSENRHTKARNRVLRYAT